MAQKILSVDDDRDLVMSLEQALKHNGFEVTCAYSGTEGLKMALEVKPDLIVLDVMMERDTAGFEVAYQIRSERETSKYREIREIPIIMLTAINQVTNSRFSLNEEESFLPKVNDFITKPVKVDDLIAKMKSIL